MNTLKFMIIIVFFFLIFALGGCSSIVAHSDKQVTPLPYAGTKAAMRKTKKSWYKYDFYGQVYFYSIDVNFSFITDTLLYPIDVYRLTDY